MKLESLLTAVYSFLLFSINGDLFVCLAIGVVRNNHICMGYNRTSFPKGMILTNLTTAG